MIVLVRKTSFGPNVWLLLTYFPLMFYAFDDTMKQLLQDQDVEMIDDGEVMTINKEGLGDEELGSITPSSPLSHLSTDSSSDAELQSISFKKKERPHCSESVSTNVEHRKLLKVLRRAGTSVSNLYREIDQEISIMLLGDIFIHKGIFSDCRDGRLSNLCPVSQYRPVIRTERTSKYCLAYLDNSREGIHDLQFPAQLLSKLNFEKAHWVMQRLEVLTKLYEDSSSLLEKVRLYYGFDQSKIEEVIGNNHLTSMKIAKGYLQRITQDKILMFHYKKIDEKNLMHKLHFTGSNLTMSELFTASSNLDQMEQYMNRVGTPRYIDAEGIVNLTVAKFSGQQQFQLRLLTLDDLVVPLNCTIKRIFLNAFEIIPGVEMSEYLDIHILDPSLNIMQDLLAKRALSNPDPSKINSPSISMMASHLSYGMEAELFIQRFYDIDQ